MAGTFDRFDENEVTELPNAADISEIELRLQGERFDLTTGTIEKYVRELCLKDGQLHRYVRWTSPRGKRYELHFWRMVSLKRLHVIAQKVQIVPMDEDTDVRIVSFINGRMTNSGTQHFSDREKRIYAHCYMQLLQETIQSHIVFVHNMALKINGSSNQYKPTVTMDRRRIGCDYCVTVKKGQTLEIEKISNVYTTRDVECQQMTIDELKDASLQDLKQAVFQGYDRLFKESATAWEEKVWSKATISIEAKNPKDVLAVHFAQYHMQIMTPWHDSRLGIGAKGLSGEGYKGHAFWDMDIFILPYYIFTMPKIARNLLEYRYHLLPKAREKAQQYGCEGAQYPWEAADLSEGEVTPKWGVANVLTGEPTRIWSGEKEIHITADVAYAVWLYVNVSNDHDFMNQYGYEMIFETAKYWTSRLEYNEKDHQYHINDVLGPDEYKEHVDDNAFTNYMAYWNIKKAIKYYNEIHEKEPASYERLTEKLGLVDAYKKWIHCINQIYLPKSREKDMVIPQDSTYLTLEDIDLSKYKKQIKIGSILFDYSIDQVGKIQVSKQADILMMFLLLEDMFKQEVTQANWKYYEQRTLHDSSLSLSTHCVLACDRKEKELAYELYQKASAIDLGEGVHTSDEGIHAAAMGGIWQCVAYGFGGIRITDDLLRIEPYLPEEWNRLRYHFYYQGQLLFIDVEKDSFTIEHISGSKEIKFVNKGVIYTIRQQQKCKVMM